MTPEELYNRYKNRTALRFNNEHELPTIGIVVGYSEYCLPLIIEVTNNGFGWSKLTADDCIVDYNEDCKLYRYIGIEHIIKFKFGRNDSKGIIREM